MEKWWNSVNCKSPSVLDEESDTPNRIGIPLCVRKFSTSILPTRILAVIEYGSRVESWTPYGRMVVENDRARWKSYVKDPPDPIYENIQPENGVI